MVETHQEERSSPRILSPDTLSLRCSHSGHVRRHSTAPKCRWLQSVRLVICAGCCCAGRQPTARTTSILRGGLYWLQCGTICNEELTCETVMSCSRAGGEAQPRRSGKSISGHFRAAGTYAAYSAALCTAASSNKRKRACVALPFLRGVTHIQHINNHNT